jgi:hypothetical protein
MTEQASEKKKKAGGIRQYATLGRGNTPKRLDAQTSNIDNTETLERPNVEVSERLKSLEEETLRRSDVQESKRPDGSGDETSERLSVQDLEHSEAKAPKRERHTIYFPPELSEWVKIRAIKDKQEISELVTEAVKRYRSEIE